MKIYCAVLGLMNILATGIALGEKNQEKIWTYALSSFIYLPIFGRIFGWW